MNIGIIPLISAIVSFIFGITVLDQYFAGDSPFNFYGSSDYSCTVSALSLNFILRLMAYTLSYFDFGIYLGLFVWQPFSARDSLSSGKTPHRSYFNGNPGGSFHLCDPPIIYDPY